MCVCACEGFSLPTHRHPSHGCDEEAGPVVLEHVGVHGQGAAGTDLQQSSGMRRGAAVGAGELACVHAVHHAEFFRRKQVPQHPSPSAPPSPHHALSPPAT